MQTLKQVFPRGGGLLKQDLAAQLHEEILSGRIAPGERIVEGTWARRFEVAQSSVREALNILASEGLVQKGHGRSARVVHLSQGDIVSTYQVRAALEGLAARLICEQKLPIGDLEERFAETQQATAGDDLRHIIDSVLRFHLTLCGKPGNYCLIQHARPILIPLFAFTLIRALSRGLTGEPWRRGLPAHRQILEALHSGDAFFAEQVVARAILGFLKTALEVWAHE
jgi:DNA-binding GntR family transcriptional regulator